MILDTKTAKIVLWSAAICLSLLAVLVAVTGWDGSSDTSAAETEDTAAITSTVSVEPQVIEDTSSSQNPAKDISSDELVAQPSATETAASNSPQSPASSRVYINPATFEISPGSEFTLTVEAQIQDSGISGSELSLNFDPEILQVVEISTEGVLGSNPLVGMEDIDYGKGLIRYAIARRGQTEVTGEPETIAKIKFRITDSAPEGIYKLTLSEINLTGSDFKPITGFEIQGGSLTVTG